MWSKFRPKHVLVEEEQMVHETAVVLLFMFLRLFKSYFAARNPELPVVFPKKLINKKTRLKTVKI